MWQISGFTWQRGLAAFAAWSGLCACGPAFANQEPVSGNGAALQAAPVARPLTLNDVIQRVKTNYPKLIGAEAERQAAQSRRIAAQGAFDTNVRVGSNYEQYNSSGKLKEFTAHSLTVEVLTRLGISIFAGVQLNEGAVKSPLSSTGETGLYNVGVRVPLLRGFGMNSRLAAERQAVLGEAGADANFAGLQLDTLLTAANQYWNWVAAGRRVKVAQDLQQVAETRAAQIRDEVQAGARQGLDAFEAEAEVQRRREARFKAERDHQKEAFKLSLYLGNIDPMRPETLTHEHLPPPSSVPTPLPPERVETGRRQALQKRPEIRAIDIAGRSVQIDSDLARNEMLPNVDFVFNPGLDTGYNSVGGQVKYGLTFAIPLGQRSARGKQAEVRLKAEKIRQDALLLRQQVAIEVADAASAINAVHLRYQAAQAEYQAAKTLEQGERDRLALGEGTLFLVNQRERATAETAVKIINIQAEYDQAQAAFSAATAAWTAGVQTP